MFPVSILSPVAWTIPVFMRIPKLSDDFNGLITWCAEQVEIRRKMKVEIPDITTWLLQALEEGNDPETDIKWLHGDSRLVVVAGSDTTHASLTFLFYHLAAEPKQVEKLRQEIDELWPEGTEFEAKNVLNAAHLNAMIHESLRLHPPVPSGVTRVTPKEGVEVDGVFIPGGVTVSVPNWAIGRREKYFPQPNEFIPERWTTRPDLLLNKDAFAPFSLGKTSIPFDLFFLSPYNLLNPTRSLQLHRPQPSSPPTPHRDLSPHTEIRCRARAGGRWERGVGG